MSHERHLIAFCQSIRATSAVEFAILAPFFLSFLVGITAFGIHFGASHAIQQIAADAARAAVAGLDAEERHRIVRDYIEAHADGYVFVERGRIMLDAGPSEADPRQYRVALRYDAGSLPIWNLFEGFPMPGRTITRVSTIRVGGL